MGPGMIVKAEDLAVNDTVTNFPPKSVHYSGVRDNKQNKKHLDNQSKEKSLLEKGYRQ